MSTESPNMPAGKGADKADSRKSGLGRSLGRAIGCVIFAYAVLLIPERSFQPPLGAGKHPFLWNKDQFWIELEQEFLRARRSDSVAVSNQWNAQFAQAASSLEELKSNALTPGNAAFASLETGMFGLAPLAAANPGRVAEFAALVENARTVTKHQSKAWDLKEPKARDQLYRLLFGGRMALEMVMIQAPDSGAMPVACSAEPSATPAVTTHGVTFHSGDILVSRGGAPTSSLIARGNDYPGSFSHAALLHVDEQTAQATVIESLIECGVRTIPFSEFLDEKRLRLMALRLRSDLPAVRSNPQLPHQAAASALRAARRGHTPYDFAMNFRDPGKKFCSEVVSSAYGETGVRLWMGMTFISSPTVTAWLASTGVRHFETQEPSDLEYDPQLRVVAEWRDPAKLFQAHLDDAVTDAMFEAAEAGQPLDYSLAKLPPARVVKAYSALLNAFGRVGPVPEGMSATSALRAKQFAAEHKARKARLAKLAEEFQARNGYAAPYWELVSLAKAAKQ